MLPDLNLFFSFIAAACEQRQLLLWWWRYRWVASGNLYQLNMFIILLDQISLVNQASHKVLYNQELCMRVIINFTYVHPMDSTSIVLDTNQKFRSCKQTPRIHTIYHPICTVRSNINWNSLKITLVFKIFYRESLQ